jgi:hypothetical protein
MVEFLHLSTNLAVAFDIVVRRSSREELIISLQKSKLEKTNAWISVNNAVEARERRTG